MSRTRAAANAIETEWHNYKSARTNKLAGAYFYIPTLSEANLGHVYQPQGMSGWYARSFVPGVLEAGYIGATFERAKEAMVKAFVAHINGQGDLFPNPPIC